MRWPFVTRKEYEARDRTSAEDTNLFEHNAKCIKQLGAELAEATDRIRQLDADLWMVRDFIKESEESEKKTTKKTNKKK